MKAIQADGLDEGPHPCDRFDWERVVRRVTMPAGVKFIAFALATYADRDGTRIHPSNARLANVIEKSERTVERGMSWLQSAGFIVVTRRGNRYAGQANEYRLSLPPDVLDRLALDINDQRSSPDKGVG